jgi:hypothetical protein
VTGGRLLSTEHPEKPLSGVLSDKESRRLRLRSKRRSSFNVLTTNQEQEFESLPPRHRWPDLNAVVVVESRREHNGKITDETRFYITSLVMPAAAVGPMIRARWAIENPLHWVMDMVFRDDECRVRTDNARPISQPPAHRSQSHPQGSGQRFHPPPAQNRQVGTTSISPTASPPKSYA